MPITRQTRTILEDQATPDKPTPDATLNWLTLHPLGFDLYLVARQPVNTQTQTHYSASISKWFADTQYTAFYCDGKAVHTQQFPDTASAQKFVAGLVPNA